MEVSFIEKINPWEDLLFSSIRMTTTWGPDLADLFGGDLWAL